MREDTASPVPWSFWAIAAIALIWNGLGAMNFIVQMDPDSIDAYRETERAIIVGRPDWATGGFAIAVFGGALGSFLLLIRNRSAVFVFIFSLLGVIVTMMHTLGLGVEFSVGELIGIILMPVVVAVFLVWYARYAERQEWID